MYVDLLSTMIDSQCFYHFFADDFQLQMSVPTQICTFPNKM